MKARGLGGGALRCLACSGTSPKKNLLGPLLAAKCQIWALIDTNKPSPLPNPGLTPRRQSLWAGVAVWGLLLAALISALTSTVLCG
jgi:hypothetical protein